MLREFKTGFARIVKNSGYPIIPVYIGGAWGSILSYAHGRLLSRPPALSPYPVNILFGKPLPATSTAMEVRQAVMELSCDYFNGLKPKRCPLVANFIAIARRYGRRRAMADSSGKSLSYAKTLVATIALADTLKGVIGKEEHVGVLLPPSVAGILANLALSLLGRVPVNLNYTAAEASFLSAIRQCEIETVLTSRAFLDKVKVPPLANALHMEDLVAGVSLPPRSWPGSRPNCSPPPGSAKMPDLTPTVPPP